MKRLGRTVKLGTWACALLSLAAFGTSALFAQDPACKPALIQNPQLIEWEALDGNQINCTIASDGPYADYRATNSAGFEWPKASGKTAIYTAGIWMVGRHIPSDSLRTAVMDYNTEYQPGPLLETFNTSTNNDAGPVSRAKDARYRLYRIERSDTLSTDYLEWPGDLGAPWVDMNANGSWDQGSDKPRLYGDQQIWCVMNDVNKAQHTVLGATPPMGVEVRVLYWVFDQPGVLENTMFMRWQIMNRSDADYDSVYLALWDDVDLGFPSDDLPGCDTTLDMGYVYNGDNDDAGSSGYGSTPPAIGIVLLQGPIVPGLPGDVARFAEGLKPGFRNLGMTSFLPSACGTYPLLNCPPDGDPDYAPMAYNYLQAKLATGAYLTRPDSSIMNFVFSGDPVSGTGDLPSEFPLGPWNPQEAYVLTNSGPFSLARGDTQEVVAAVVMSQGTDRLNSVSRLREDVAAVRTLYASGIVVDVQTEAAPLPETHELFQNYPNPFNPATTIRYELPAVSEVKLSVFDMLGREVASLVNERRDAGVHEVRFDASHLASGVYLYRLSRVHSPRRAHSLCSDSSTDVAGGAVGSGTDRWVTRDRTVSGGS